MTTERYHKAARDGYLEALKEGTKRDLNSRDEDGMTPTLWAAFEGHVEALRLIVGRGGDPDKCDNYGNSALHFAAARGHMPCLSFLVNFGVNLWALDIDFHTPKDLAAINNKEQILRFLDAAIAKEEARDRKKVKGLQEKAEKEAEKRGKEFEKLQKKASKSVEEEQRKLAKQREKMERGGGTPSSEPPPSRPALPFMSLRTKEPRAMQSPKFSEIVSSAPQSSGGTLVSRLKPTHFTGVYKKVQQRKTGGGSGTTAAGPEFKVADVEGSGTRTVRSLSGLRRDSEVMYVPKFEVPNAGKRGKIHGLFEDEGGQLSRSVSQPEFLNENSPHDGLSKHSATQLHFNDDHKLPHQTTSIFERPGFGSVAFRANFSSTLGNFSNLKKSPPRRGVAEDEVIQRHLELLEEDEAPSDEDDAAESGPVSFFLAAAGMPTYASVFLREGIDLDALVLLTEDDLITLGIPMGPRRKLIKAVQERRDALDHPGGIQESRL